VRSMNCSACGRHGGGEGLPHDWKVCGRLILCCECRRQRFRRRPVTLAVAEPIGATWLELCAALEDAWRRAAPLLIEGTAWKLSIEAGQPVVRTAIGDRRWALRLNGANCPHRRRVAYEGIASGEALAGDLLLDRNSRVLRSPSGIICKLVAWLPRASPAGARQQNIEEMDIGRVRAAIHANRASFPSQVPAFPSCGRPELQHKLVQLYFVRGWHCSVIAARYGLTAHRLRCILNTWKWRAANAGYIQHIPPEEADHTPL